MDGEVKPTFSRLGDSLVKEIHFSIRGFLHGLLIETKQPPFHITTQGSRITLRLEIPRISLSRRERRAPNFGIMQTI